MSKGEATRVTKNKIEIDITPSGSPTFQEVCGLTDETFNIDDTIVTEFFNCGDGKADNTKVAQNITFSFSGKRKVGNEGQDYVVGLALDIDNSKTTVRWTRPNGDVYELKATISNIVPFGGATADTDAFGFDAMIADGEITFIPSTTPAPALTSQDINDGDIDIAVSGTVNFELNNDLEEATVNTGTVKLEVVGGAQVTLDSVDVTGDKTFSFDYSGLNNSAEYRIILDGIKDEFGQELALTIINFTTVA